jgi:SAM-dependent methyltransferase
MSANYEEVPYVGLPISTAHPWRLRWTATVFGGPRPNRTTARVLELGCGDGATLLPLAAHEPTWTVHGIDASEHAIAFAQAGATRCGLRNATFECADVAAATIEPGAWDIVIAHGLYSWIDPPRQAAVRRLIRQALAADGLGYVSFNAMPGWAVRGCVRDLIRREPSADARHLLDRLHALSPSDAWGQLLSRELLRARDARPDYLAHEYLADDNHAFWLGDFVRDAADAGLRWLGDAQFDLPEGRPYEQTKTLLGVPGIRGEELVDLLGYRQFRCAVLARDDAPMTPPADDDELLRCAFVSGFVTPTDENFEVAAAREESMRSADGMELRVAEPLGKAALLELARIYPDAIGFDDLLRRARDVLTQHGVTEVSTRAEREVAEGIIRLWRAGALELRLHCPNLRTQRADHPEATALTRYEASVRPVISTSLGRIVPVDGVDRFLIERCDGTRRNGDLIDQLKQAIARGDVVLDGINPASKVEGLIAFLARWGLLVSR